jgi:hypothetical protein
MGVPAVFVVVLIGVTELLSSAYSVRPSGAIARAVALTGMSAATVPVATPQRRAVSARPGRGGRAAQSVRRALVPRPALGCRAQGGSCALAGSGRLQHRKNLARRARTGSGQCKRPQSTVRGQAHSSQWTARVSCCPRRGDLSGIQPRPTVYMCWSAACDSRQGEKSVNRRLSLRWFEPITCHHQRERLASCEFSRLASRFACPGVCHCVSRWTVVLRYPRTYSGRRPGRARGRCAPSLLRGRPRTGRFGGRRGLTSAVELRCPPCAARRIRRLCAARRMRLMPLSPSRGA